MTNYCIEKYPFAYLLLLYNNNFFFACSCSSLSLSLLMFVSLSLEDLLSDPSNLFYSRSDSISLFLSLHFLLLLFTIHWFVYISIYAFFTCYFVVHGHLGFEADMGLLFLKFVADLVLCAGWLIGFVRVRCCFWLFSLIRHLGLSNFVVGLILWCRCC